MSNPNSRKSCIVPKCTNTTINSPKKLFFIVPMEVKMRRKWIKAVNRLDPFGNKSSVYCCEDHFDIENDMENYIKYKLVGGRLKLKQGVVPHKFKCQQKKEDKPEKSEEIFVASCENEVAINETDEKDPLNFGNNDKCSEISNKSKGLQVNLKAKGFYKLSVTGKSCLKKARKIFVSPDVRSMNDTSYDSSHEMFNFEQQSKNTNQDSESECEEKFFRNYMQKAALLSMSREPQMLLGLPKECYFCINMLSETTNCTPRNIMLTLKKIRLYQSDTILALDFGLSANYVTKIIRVTVPAIASVLKSLVYFPRSSDVQLNLPIPFRKKYKKVQSVINCIEIQIEKPIDAEKQALTWSDYKNCNTIKYLISITPDGLINFISPGYGGRATGSLVFKDCGVLQALPEGSAVLVDRGFKNIAHLLQQNGLTLMRLPSVSTKLKPTKKELLETKNIAAIRMHIERANARLRFFKFMVPYACVDLKQVDLLDSMVISACAIVNLQSSLSHKSSVSPSVSKQNTLWVPIS